MYRINSSQRRNGRKESVIRHLFLCALCLIGVKPAFAGDDVAAMLQRADAYRLADAESRVEIAVRLYDHDKLDKEKRYSVFVKPGRRSLVLFRSAGEAGQKVLMLDDAFWMLMPGTRRPIRITPMQKLLGEASTGDVTTLTWSEDYRGKLVDSDYHGEFCAVACRQLELTSARKGTSYQRIELWLDRNDVPLYARLYLKSGRLAKEARYTLGTLEGKRRITAMTLYDSINTSKRTEIVYRSMAAASIPDKYYNPVFLQRENLEGW
jgi:hypothetical protein